MATRVRIGHPVLFRREPRNPILTPDDWPYPVHTVMNPGATLLPDGTTLLLCRVEDRRGISHLTAARSRNGVDGWEIDATPTMMPDPAARPEELWGIEDARIVYAEELDAYVLTYTAVSISGPGVALSTTTDFRSFEHYGFILPPDNKDSAILPRRIGGNWALIHRPSNPGGAHIWIAYSPDLRHWGSHRLVLAARRGTWWDANKIGLSPPVIETSRGWLMLYHGVRTTASGSIYRIGLALLDRNEPEHCLLRGDHWIFAPEEPYEREGDVDDVVFPCGYTVGPDGDTLNIYYGGADSCIALARASIGELLEWLDHNGRPYDATPPIDTVIGQPDERLAI